MLPSTRIIVKPGSDFFPAILIHPTGISWATFSIYVGQKELDYHYPCLSPFLELKRIIDEKVSLYPIIIVELFCSYVNAKMLEAIFLLI
jgi:hypothetical protein